MRKRKHNILNKFIITMLFLSILSTCIPITAKAGYGGNGEVQNSVDGDIDIALESIGFDDHKGMKAYINGQEVFCIQRGYPFRSKVSELQMVYSTVQSGLAQVEHDGTIASLIRYMLSDLTSLIGVE